MKNSLVFLSLALSFSTFSTGCGQACKVARNEVITPVKEVTAYLETRPSGETLAQSGCAVIIDDLAKIPANAEKMRTLADEQFSNTYRSCTHYTSGVQLVCTPIYRYRPYPPHPVYPYPPQCFNRYFTYCDSWQYNTVREPGYETAINLSRDLDILFDKAHVMCGLASRGSFAEAEAASRDLLALITDKVRPEGTRIYGLACGGAAIN